MEEDHYKVPAFLRKSELKRKAAKKILYTAWDREQARLQKGAKKKSISNVPIKPSLKMRAVVQRRSVNTSPYRSVFLNLNPDLPVVSKLSKDQPKISLTYIGNIEDFFEKISVAVIHLKGEMKVGDIIIVGNKAEVVESIQINRQPVPIAYSGDDIGIKVKNMPQRGAKVFNLAISS